MKTVSLLVILMIGFHAIKAQVNDPNQVAKDAASNHANNDLDNAADKGVSKAEQGIGNLFKKKTKQPKNDSAAQAKANASTATAGMGNRTQVEEPKPLKVYANYDFVPGDKILFEDNFAEDKDGEFPIHWQLEKGQGILNSLKGIESFYLTDGNYVIVNPLVKNASYLTNQFTVEYDTYNPENGAYGLLVFFRDASREELGNVQVSPSSADYTWAEGKNLSGSLPLEIQSDNFKNKWHHIAIAYNNKQLKVYVDQFRVLYVPNAEITPASLAFGGIGDPNSPVIFKNIRIASGGSMYMVGHKFTDAKIVTHGINFDVDRATIKPESMGTLNMVVQVLKENPELRFEIDGHTDNSGGSAHNLTLSQQRAESVKLQLISMGVDAGRLTTKGFGDGKPIADNNSTEGKANNRRVEFVKI